MGTPQNNRLDDDRGIDDRSVPFFDCLTKIKGEKAYGIREYIGRVQ